MSIFLCLIRKQTIITTKVYEYTELHFNPSTVIAYMYITKKPIKSKLKTKTIKVHSHRFRIM